MHNIYTYLKVKENKKAVLITIENNKKLKKKSKNRNISYKKNFKSQCIYYKKENMLKRNTENNTLKRISLKRIKTTAVILEILQTI